VEAMSFREEPARSVQQVVGQRSDLESSQGRSSQRNWVEAVCLDPMIPPAGAGPPAYPARCGGTSADPDFGAKGHPIDGNPRHVYPPTIPDRHPRSGSDSARTPTRPAPVHPQVTPINMPGSGPDQRDQRSRNRRPRRRSPSAMRAPVTIVFRSPVSMRTALMRSTVATDGGVVALWSR